MKWALHKGWRRISLYLCVPAFRKGDGQVGQARRRSLNPPEEANLQYIGVGSRERSSVYFIKGQEE